MRFWTAKLATRSVFDGRRSVRFLRTFYTENIVARGGTLHRTLYTRAAKTHPSPKSRRRLFIFIIFLQSINSRNVLSHKTSDKTLCEPLKRRYVSRCGGKTLTIKGTRPGTDSRT